MRENRNKEIIDLQEERKIDDRNEELEKAEEIVDENEHAERNEDE